MTKRQQTIVGPTDRLFGALERSRAGVSLLETSGTREASSFDLALSIRSGIAASAWTRLRALGFTAPELASVVGVSEKTISRKRGAEALTIAESDRTIRLAQFALDAAQAFGDFDKAMRWLRKPNRVLGGERPLDLIATEPGVVLVYRVLGTIEYGGLA